MIYDTPAHVADSALCIALCPCATDPGASPLVSVIYVGDGNAAPSQNSGWLKSQCLQMICAIRPRRMRLSSLRVSASSREQPSSAFPAARLNRFWDAAFMQGANWPPLNMLSRASGYAATNYDMIGLSKGGTFVETDSLTYVLLERCGTREAPMDCMVPPYKGMVTVCSTQRLCKAGVSFFRELDTCVTDNSDVCPRPNTMHDIRHADGLFVTSIIIDDCKTFRNFFSRARVVILTDTAVSAGCAGFTLACRHRMLVKELRALGGMRVISRSHPNL